MAAPGGEGPNPQAGQNGTPDSMRAVFGLLAMLFVAVPILEILVIIEVAGVLGALETVVLLVAISLVGAWLVRREGLGLIASIRRQLDRGEMPTDELVDGVLVAVAGALLLTPGFVTDAVGLALLVRPTRAVVRRRLLARFETRVTAYRVDATYRADPTYRAGGTAAAPGPSPIVDVTDVRDVGEVGDGSDATDR